MLFIYACHLYLSLGALVNHISTGNWAIASENLPIHLIIDIFEDEEFVDH